MLMMPSDASDLTCPYIRMPTQFQGSCLGTRCMAWRWGEDEKAFKMIVCDDTHANVEPRRPDYVPASYTFSAYDAAEGQPAAWIEPDDERKGRRRGYCGLAGKPMGVNL